MIVFFTYLRRELLGRRKQTIIIAIGLGVAIGLAITLNALAAGAQAAQAKTLKNLFGIGTDLSVVSSEQPDFSKGGPGGAIDFNPADADADGWITHSTLMALPGKTLYSQSDASKAASVPGVEASAAALDLTTLTLKGHFPNAKNGLKQPDVKNDTSTGLGIDPTHTDVGPLSSTKVVTGRMLSAEDKGKNNAVLDDGYAQQQKLKVGDTLKLGKSDFTIVGTVTSTSTSTQSSTNFYIPLDSAQTAADLKDKVSIVYLKATSSSEIGAVKDRILKAVPKVKVNTQDSLASGVQSTVAQAAQTLTNLSFWLSIGVLAAAFLLAVLFTLQGVSRRIREFGTLRAIGWRTRRVVAQVAGESVLQSLVGGVLGIVLGIGGILILNAMNIQIGGAPHIGGLPEGGGPALPSGGVAMNGGAAGNKGATFIGSDSAANAVTTLHMPIGFEIVFLAVGLAILGGLIAGAVGGLRASRFRPAEALRSV